MQKILDLKKINSLLLIVAIYVILSLISNYIFVSYTILSQWYEGILTQTQIHETVTIAKKWEWGIILLNVLIVFIRISFVSSCLYLGLFFFFEKYNSFNSYKISFNVALKAEIVLLLYSIVRLLWFGIIHIPESPEEMNVMPLSLMHFFDPATIEPWLIYPLNTFNVFEVFYVWMLSALMAVAIQTKFRKAFEIVFVSYGAGLLLLMVAQMFLILNNT